MIITEGEITNDVLKETIESNVLRRNSKLMMLSNLLSKADKNLIVSIDGRWGSGKTFFVKQFKYLIENIDDYTNNKEFDDYAKKSFRDLRDTSLVVYYNAWENDMHNDALESLMYNIMNEYPSMKDQLADFNSFKEMFMSFARDFVYASSNGILDLDNFQKLDSFEDLAKNIKTIEEKKKAFNNLIDCILGNKNRMILIIDELDRCKPSFAVELLETIKHFYNNDKITVIVSTNNSELAHTIKKYYGENFDGYGYLNKFYDFSISLEGVNLKKYLQQRFNFCNNTYIHHDMSYLVMLHYDFSLRECNRFITLYSMLRAYIEDDPKFGQEYAYIYKCILIPLALALRMKNIEKYNSFVNGKGEDIINEYLDKEISNLKYEQWIRELAKIKEEANYKDEVLKKYREVFNDEYKFGKYQFLDAVSMLGNELLIE